jgi:hypothetical protein
MECFATRRFAAEDSDKVIIGSFKAYELDAARIIEFLDYKRALGRVQPGNPECIRLPRALLIPGLPQQLQHLRRRWKTAD